MISICLHRITNYLRNNLSTQSSTSNDFILEPSSPSFISDFRFNLFIIFLTSSIFVLCVKYCSLTLSIFLLLRILDSMLYWLVFSCFQSLSPSCTNVFHARKCKSFDHHLSLFQSISWNFHYFFQRPLFFQATHSLLSTSSCVSFCREIVCPRYVY